MEFLYESAERALGNGIMLNTNNKAFCCNNNQVYFKLSERIFGKISLILDFAHVNDIICAQEKLTSIFVIANNEGKAQCQINVFGARGNVTLSQHCGFCALK